MKTGAVAILALCAAMSDAKAQMAGDSFDLTQSQVGFKYESAYRKVMELVGQRDRVAVDRYLRDNSRSVYQFRAGQTVTIMQQNGLGQCLRPRGDPDCYWTFFPRRPTTDEQAAAARPREESAYMRGVSALDSGHFDEAISLFDQALKEHPRDFWTVFKRGSAYERSGQRDKALSDYWTARNLTTNTGEQFSLDRIIRRVSPKD